MIPKSNIPLSQSRQPLIAAFGAVAIWCVFLTAGHAQIADKMVAYWPFEDGLEDATGNDYNGLEQGGDPIAFTDAKFGRGMVLDGIDQYVEVQNSEEEFNFIDQSFSLSAWFKVNAFTKSWQALAAKGEGNRWRIHRRGGESVVTFNGGNGDVPGGATSVDDGEWYHIAVVRDLENDEARLYINGELDGSNTALNPEENFNPMMIGENPDALGRTWDGCIDDMAVWCRVLTEDEISDIYNGGTGNEIAFLLNPEDSDGDGMPDRYEVDNGLDPNDDDSDLDKDGDTLTNLSEFENGTLAGKADSDDDGLNDNVETKTGTWVSATDTGTKPRNPDSDGDGLKDGVETNTGVFVSATDTGTNPNVKDTDGDGAADGLEVEAGTNPLDENEVPSAIISNGDWDIIHVYDGSQINDALSAEEAIAGDLGGESIEVEHPHIHFHDNAAPPWFVDLSEPYPAWGPKGDDSGFGDRNDFAIQACGKINVKESGTHTFVCNSDDGFVLTIDDEIVGEAGNRGRGNTIMEVDLSAGLHDVKFIHWERGGGAGVTVAVFRGIGVAPAPNADDWELLRPFVDTSDTDGDGMTDLYEVANELDPEVDDAGLDKDGDGLTNLQEFQKGTRANKADTDDDGLNDNVETGTGTWVDADDRGTDPLKPDTDGDELLDGVETNTGIFVSATDTGTDPNKGDTDGDTVADGKEVARGFNPTDPNSPPPPPTEGFGAGLIAYWPFESSLLDEAPDRQPHDGTGMGGDPIAYGEGVFGEALCLDGVDQFVEIDRNTEEDFDVPDGTGFTLSAWFQVGAFTKSWQALAAKGEGNRWRIHRRSGESLMTFNGGNADVPAGATAVDDGAWYHLVAVSDPETDEARLYINGELEASNSGLNLENNAQPLMIGENPDARGRTWEGKIDDMAFWQRVLSEEEIAEIWNGGDGSEIAALLGGGGPGFQITEVTKTGDKVTITWPSRDGQSFIVEQSFDGNSFVWEELTDGHPSGGETTTFEATVPDDVTALWFRVKRE